jgi:hypothetical protein
MSVAGGPLRLSSLVQRLWRTGRFFLPPTLVVLAYLGFNRWWFGTAIPISGRIKSIPPLQLFSRSYDWTAAGRRVRGLMTPDFLERLQSFGEGLLPGASIIILLIFLGVVFAAVVFLMRARGSEFSLRTLTLFVALHIAYYALLQKDPYSLAWAKGPELLLTLLVMAFLLGHLLRLGKLRDRAAAWICITLVFSSGVYSHSRRLGDMTRVYDFSVSREDFDNAVQFIERSVPKNEPIMTWNIGFLGYYTRRPVVSYDGLLNSLAYFEQYQSKQRVADYMRERGIRYIANRIPLQGDPATLLAGQFSGLHPDDLEILAMFDRGRTQPKVLNRYVVARCHW